MEALVVLLLTTAVYLFIGWNSEQPKYGWSERVQRALFFSILLSRLQPVFDLFHQRPVSLDQGVWASAAVLMYALEGKTKLLRGLMGVSDDSQRRTSRRVLIAGLILLGGLLVWLSIDSYIVLHSQ